MLISTPRLTVKRASVVLNHEEIVSVPKTRRSRRVVDVDPETVETLRQYWVLHS